MSKQVDYVAEIKKMLNCDGIAYLTQKIVKASKIETYGHSANYVCVVGPFKFFVKLAPYLVSDAAAWEYLDKEKDLSGEVEANIMRAIKKRIIDANISPHFTEILAVVRCHDVEKYITDKKTCEQQHLQKIQPDNYPQSVLCIFDGYAKSNLIFDKFSLVFSECCEMPILHFISQHLPALASERDMMIISIIFQVYYTLAAAQHIWASFRHGDLYEYNIMIKFGNEEPTLLHNRHYLRYNFLGQVWNIPYYGFYVKIIDFGHAEIHEEGIINKYIKSPNRIWIDDHITFIISIENILASYPHEKTQTLNNVLTALNNLRFRLGALSGILKKYKNTFRTPKEALQLHIFNMFETSVDDNLVLHEYITRDK